MWHTDWVGPTFLIINHQKSWAPIVWRGLNSTKSELGPLSKSENLEKKNIERERGLESHGERGFPAPRPSVFSKGYQKGAFQPYAGGCSWAGFVPGRRIPKPKPVHLAIRTGADSSINFSFFFFYFLGQIHTP